MNRKAVEKNEEESVRLLQLAVNQGFALAQTRLGCCYMKGMKGAEEDYVAGFEFFKLAAVQGDDEGQLNVGRCYLEGSGITKDEEKAEQFFRLAAAPRE